jgi:hypothetical protein
MGAARFNKNAFGLKPVSPNMPFPNIPAGGNGACSIDISADAAMDNPPGKPALDNIQVPGREMLR